MFLSNKSFQHVLQRQDPGIKLSIYVPTHPASTSPTISEDTIRFKNALQEIRANEQYDERELGNTMQKMELLLDDIEFWKHRTLGLAVFASKDGYETVDLNYEITDMHYVQDSFVISPLAIMLSIGTGYFVLDINQTKPRLIHFTSSAKEEVAADGMPGTFEETVKRVDYQDQQQHQSVAGNMFHGHSETAALIEDELRYYKLIAACADEYLADHDEPLLLAGTESRIGHMRPLIRYGNVLEATLAGNNEELNEQDMLDATETEMKSLDMVKRGALVDTAKATPLSKLAMGATEIEAAIAEGKVDTLYLSAFRNTTDNIRDNYQSTVVLQLPEDILAIETLVRGALLQGADVIAVAQGSFDTNEPRAILRF